MNQTRTATATGGLADQSADPGRDDANTARGPIVVLAYPHAGAELLAELLSASQSLEPTSGTGLIPLCHAALSSWQQAEGRNRPPSALAIKSVRSLAAAMVGVIQARTGATRWCETVLAAPEVAGTFRQVFPGATFVCLHRSLRAVLAEGLRTNPLGLGGSPFWPYSGPHPGNNVATIAAYWADRTESLLEFESGHAGSCLRVRYEDLATDSDEQARELYARLGLDARDLAVPRRLDDDKFLAEADTASLWPGEWPTRIPPPLLPKLDDLHARLGYAPLLTSWWP
jgi:hypothetical protein